MKTRHSLTIPLLALVRSPSCISSDSGIVVSVLYQEDLEAQRLGFTYIYIYTFIDIQTFQRPDIQDQSHDVLSFPFLLSVYLLTFQYRAGQGAAREDFAHKQNHGASIPTWQESEFPLGIRDARIY